MAIVGGGIIGLATAFRKALSQTLSFSGTWRLFINHWQFGLNECKGAFSKSLFLKELQKMMPSPAATTCLAIGE